MDINYKSLVEDLTWNERNKTSVDLDAPGVLSSDSNVSDSELQNRDAQTPQTIDSFLNDEIFKEFRIEGNLVRCSNAECREALGKKLIDFFNNPEADLVGDLLNTAIYPQDEGHRNRALIALEELKTCADNMPPEDAAMVLSVIEGYVQDWAKALQLQSLDEQERAAIQTGLKQMQALGIIQGDCDPNATALEFLSNNRDAIANSGNKDALHQSLENSLQDPEEASKLIKGLLNIATDNTEPPPQEKQMAATCLGELPGNQDLLSNLSSIFVSWASESPNEDIQGFVYELNKPDLLKVLKNPNQSSPADLEALGGNLQKLFNIPGKNLIQALTALTFSSDENIFERDGSEIRENALIALKGISDYDSNLKLAIEALLSAGIKNALGIYEQPANETAQQSVFAFLEMILRFNIMNPEQNLDIFPQQSDDALTLINQDIDSRVINTAFEKLADPETNEEALDLLYKMFDIYAAQAATVDQSLKGQGDKTSTKPKFPTFLTFSENLGGIFSIDSEIPSSELPRMEEQATELLMHLVNIFPSNIVEYAGDVFEETSNFLIENAPSDENALNLLEKIILSELHVFGGNPEETKSRIEKDFEKLKNCSSNSNEFQEALNRIQQELEQIGNHIAGQSGETIQNYQERLQSIYETGQDPHMWHFLVQLSKKMQWPSVTDLTDILKNEYQKFKDQGILYTLVEIYISAQDQGVRENISNFLIEQYVASEELFSTNILGLLGRMYENSQDESICTSLASKYQDTNDPEILGALTEMYKSAQDQGTCENIRNFLIEQYNALDKEENVLATGVLELLQQMYTSNPQDEGLHEFLAEREALPAAKETPTFPQLTTLVDDSEEEDQQKMFRSPGASLGASPQPFVEDDTNVSNPMNVPPPEHEKPKIQHRHHRHHHRPEQPQKQQSFLGGIGKLGGISKFAGAAWNGAVKATINLIDFFDPNVKKKKQVQLHSQKDFSSQKDFIQTTLGRTIQECGGSGHCLVLSVLRQIDPQGFNNAYNQKGGRFAMAAEFRRNLAQSAKRIRVQNPRDQKGIDNDINRLEHVYKDGRGEYLDVGSNIGSWIAQFVSRPIIVFSDDGRTAPGIVTYIHEDNDDREIIDFSEIDPTTAQNAILLYYSGNGEGGHYQAII